MEDERVFPTHAASSASSSRTVRPRHPNPQQVSDTTFYMNPNQAGTTESLDTLYTITQSRMGPPVPPARTSSLAVRGRTFHQNVASTSRLGVSGVPEVQVTHPTPTKTKKYRSRSAGQPSGMGMSMSERPMTSGSTSSSSGAELARQNQYDVDVDDGFGVGRSRRHMMDDDDDDDDDMSETDRQREVEEARKQRARDKGRERQRRKRERDKRAKEEARMTGTQINIPSSALMTATHLPIPVRNSSASNFQGYPLSHQHPLTMPSQPQQAYPFTMSVPSSTSSTYSSLPSNPHSQAQGLGQGQGFFDLSPQANQSATSISLSSQSSPGNIFSPALSTPGMGAAASDGTMWSTEASSSGSAVDLMPSSAHDNKGKSTSRSRSRPGQPNFPEANRIFQPMFAPVGSHSRRTAGSKPSKRRKSEPDPEEFRPSKTKNEEYGLGVIVGDESWQPEANVIPGERPKPRRTASEGATIPLSGRPLKSPAPQFPGSTSLAEQIETTEQGNFFATTLLYALNASGLQKQLEETLGMGSDDLQYVKAELAAVYDRWSMEKGLRDVTLAGRRGSQTSDGQTIISGSSEVSSVSGDDSHSELASPVHHGNMSANNSFFTPVPSRISRSDAVGAQTMPAFSMMSSAEQLAAQQRSPVHGGQHTRTRSLSSSKMAARGLVINPGPSGPSGYPQGGQGGQSSQAGLVGQDGKWTDTPSRQDLPSGSETNSTSPALQTPSTAGLQGSFPSTDSLGGVGAGMQDWRSATDPARMRTYTTKSQGDGSMEVEMTRDGGSNTGSGTSGEWPVEPSPLDSPLAMVKRQGQVQHQGQGQMIGMIPSQHPATAPPIQRTYVIPSMSNSTGMPQSGYQGMPMQPYGTPQRGYKGQNTVPFTPPTPIRPGSAHAQAAYGGQQIYYDPNYSAGQPMSGQMGHGTQVGSMGQVSGQMGQMSRSGHGTHEGQGQGTMMGPDDGGAWFRNLGHYGGQGT